MSSHNLLITAPAEKDIDGILEYTQKTWGNRQVAKYKSFLDKAFERITQNPQIGRPRHKLLCYHVEKHLIYYKVADETIIISRILHERMDAARHFPDA